MFYSSEYFGDSIFTYSLKQGIDDGFLAPYKVLKIALDVDLEGWRPNSSTVDTKGRDVEDRIYNTKDFDRNLVLLQRTELVAKKVIEYLTKTSPLDKTIVFCVDIEHAERMRQALWKFAPSDWSEKSDKYIMRITGDDDEGKKELDNFINPEEPYPVIATTSKLLTTGTDAKTCKLIVLDSNIGSMTEFKQIIGRGTRIEEDYGKTFFTIMDFRNVTNKFADKDFDGEPARIKNVNPEDEFSPDDIYGDSDEVQIDPVSGEEVDFSVKYGEPTERLDFVAAPEAECYAEFPDKKKRKEKIYVAGVDVSILNERTQYLSADGKRAIISELETQGIILENLQNEIKADLDIFDLICHIAFDAPALTRRERAENVKKRNCFSKYSEQARKVLEALLEKYSEEGIENIEESSILRVSPVSDFGTPTEIVKFFGGKTQFQQALRELETELYKAA